jgi:hypothetical protein
MGTIGTVALALLLANVVVAWVLHKASVQRSRFAPDLTGLDDQMFHEFQDYGMTFADKMLPPQSVEVKFLTALKLAQYERERVRLLDGVCRRALIALGINCAFASAFIVIALSSR